MKNFLTKSFGILGLAIYYALAIVVRIPVFFILLASVLCLLIVAPITGSETCCPKWADKLYDWYCDL